MASRPGEGVVRCSRDAYGQTFTADLLEQYKLYVQSAETSGTSPDTGTSPGARRRSRAPNTAGRTRLPVESCARVIGEGRSRPRWRAACTTSPPAAWRPGRNATWAETGFRLERASARTGRRAPAAGERQRRSVRPIGAGTLYAQPGRQVYPCQDVFRGFGGCPSKRPRRHRHGAED